MLFKKFQQIYVFLGFYVKNIEMDQTCILIIPQLMVRNKYFHPSSIIQAPFHLIIQRVALPGVPSISYQIKTRLCKLDPLRTLLVPLKHQTCSSLSRTKNFCSFTFALSINTSLVGSRLSIAAKQVTSLKSSGIAFDYFTFV